MVLSQMAEAYDIQPASRRPDFSAAANAAKEAEPKRFPRSGRKWQGAMEGVPRSWRLCGAARCAIGADGSATRHHRHRPGASATVCPTAEKIMAPPFGGQFDHKQIRRKIWSGRWDSNPRPQPWQGCALPLSYTRIHRPSGRGLYGPSRARLQDRKIRLTPDCDSFFGSTGTGAWTRSDTAKSPPNGSICRARQDRPSLADRAAIG